MDDRPFVGRDEELRRLRSALDDAAAGRGRLVVVRGETGIGKSRLLEEVAGLAADTHVVLTGRAVEGGGAYRPVAEALLGALRARPDIRPAKLGPYAPALARLLPDWSELAGTGLETGVDPALVLGEAVARFLGTVGGDRPCLLLLEDLQWADDDSLAIVAHVAGAASALPLLVVATVREDEPGAPFDDPLGRIPGVVVLRLARFSPEEVRRLVTLLRRDPPDAASLARLEDRADGLPFLVEELLDSGASSPSLAPVPAAPLPPTMLALVEDRLGRLTPQQHGVVAGAAVLGLGPDWSLLPQVTGTDETAVIDALRSAEAVRLLVSESGTLRWRHSLTRETVLAGLLAPERAALSRRAAEALLARDRPQDDATAADLLAKAGADDEAADLLLALSRRARRRGAFRTAERLLDHLDLTGRHPTAAATERVRLLCLAGRGHDALDGGGPALDAAGGEEHAELAFALARAAVLAGRWPSVRAYVERAGRPDDPRSATLLADAAHGAGDLVEAGRQARESVARAEAGGSPEQLCDALTVQARVLRLDDQSAAGALFRRAAQVAAEHGLVTARVEAMLGQATVEMLDTEHPDALASPRALAVEAGLLGQLTAVDLLLSDVVLARDGPAAAVPLATELVERGHALAMPMAVVAGEFILAAAAAVQGDRQGSARSFDSLPGSADAPREVPLLPAAVESLAALTAHDLPAANAALDPAVAALVDHRTAAPLYQFGLWALLRTAVDDRGAEAREAVASMPVARRRANAAALRYAEAIAAGQVGRTEDAESALADAEDLASAVPWLRRLFRQVALSSAVLDGWGDPVPLLRASLSEHEQAGEERLARVCRDLLRRAGAPTRRGRGESDVPPALAALGVTRREADVLALLAEGATNTDIAQQLFLSRRTVETHVAHLLQKTSTSSRSELSERVAALLR